MKKNFRILCWGEYFQRRNHKKIYLTKQIYSWPFRWHFAIVHGHFIFWVMVELWFLFCELWSKFYFLSYDFYFLSYVRLCSQFTSVSLQFYQVCHLKKNYSPKRSVMFWNVCIKIRFFLIFSFNKTYILSFRLLEIFAKLIEKH